MASSITIYRLREPSANEVEVKSAIAALEGCHALPTVEAIAQFSGLSKTKVTNTLRTLKQAGLVLTVKEVLNDETTT